MKGKQTGTGKQENATGKIYAPVVRYNSTTFPALPADLYPLGVPATLKCINAEWRAYYRPLTIVEVLGVKNKNTFVALNLRPKPENFSKVVARPTPLLFLPRNNAPFSPTWTRA